MYRGWYPDGSNVVYPNGYNKLYPNGGSEVTPKHPFGYKSYAEGGKDIVYANK